MSIEEKPIRFNKGDRLAVTGGHNADQGNVAVVMWSERSEGPPRFLDTVSYFVEFVEGPKVGQKFYLPDMWVEAEKTK